jgi:hypothetical protein
MSAIAGPAVEIVGMNISLAPGGPIQGASWRIPASIPAAVVPHDMGGLANACILSQSSLEQIRRLWAISIDFFILRSTKSHLLQRCRHRYIRILLLEGLQSFP